MLANLGQNQSKRPLIISNRSRHANTRVRGLRGRHRLIQDVLSLSIWDNEVLADLVQNALTRIHMLVIEIKGRTKGDDVPLA